MRAQGFHYDPPTFPSFQATMKPFLEEYNDSDSDSGSDSDESDYGYNNNKKDNNHDDSFTNNASTTTITSYRNDKDGNHNLGSDRDPESWPDMFADEDSSSSC